MTRVHGCSNSAGVFICFSGNGIGSAQFRASPRVERCVKCGRWWKLDHVSPYLSISKKAWDMLCEGKSVDEVRIATGFSRAVLEAMLKDIERDRLRRNGS